MTSSVTTLPDGARITTFDDRVWQLEQALTPEIPLHVHLVKGEIAVLIDSGLASTYPLIGQLFSTAGVRPEDVRIIFTTHAHHDHMGSHGRVQQDTGALIAAAPGSASWIQDHARQLREFAFHHPDIIPGTPDERSELLESMGGEVRVDILLQEPTRFNFGRGVELEPISVPGHVEAELAYYERSTESIILGDAITGIDWSFFHGHMRPAAYRSSVTRLRAFLAIHPVKRALLAHYPLLDRQQFLTLLDRVEAYITTVDHTILEIVRESSGSLDLETIWRSVCQRMGKVLEFRGLIMVDAHLRELTATARLERVGPDRYATLEG